METLDGFASQISPVITKKKALNYIDSLLPDKDQKE